MYTVVTEILNRANTGYSVKPFHCLTENNQNVYVKPSGGALCSSLISEWIGGRLALQMGLPAAEIGIIKVPAALAKANTKTEWHDFKAGIGFGSYSKGTDFRDLRASDLSHLDEDLLADVLLFDYWIQNNDRQMGPVSGNPNTMVHYDRSEFYLIDHDNAFDPEFNIPTFLKLHIGRNQREYWLQADRRTAWIKKAETCLALLSDFWQELPQEWLYSEFEPHQQLDPIKEILQRPLTELEAFWKPIIQ